MKIKPGDIVSIRHFSGNSPFRSIVIDIKKNIVTVKLTKEFVIFNLFDGDPIVLTFEVNGEVYNASSTLHEVNTKQGSISIITENIEQMSYIRSTERYPVSLYSDVKLRGHTKKEIATIRNMSSEGLMICTKANFDLENDLELDLYMDKAMVFVMAQVIWKLHGRHNIEYGLRTIYPNQHVKNTIKRHLDNLKAEQDEFLRNLKGI